MAYVMTPQLGRMRVNDHCSFFWAERDGLRVVEQTGDHCATCVDALVKSLAEEGIRAELFEASAGASRVLRRVEHDR